MLGWSVGRRPRDGVKGYWCCSWLHDIALMLAIQFMLIQSVAMRQLRWHSFGVEFKSVCWKTMCNDCRNDNTTHHSFEFECANTRNLIRIGQPETTKCNAQEILPITTMCVDSASGCWLAMCNKVCGSIVLFVRICLFVFGCTARPNARVLMLVCVGGVRRRLFVRARVVVQTTTRTHTLSTQYLCSKR